MEAVRQSDRKPRTAALRDAAVHVPALRRGALQAVQPSPVSRREEVDRYLGEVQRIGVFRALGLGDLLCATPALRALQQRFPQARITLISLPWAEALAQRLDGIDEFIAFPGHPMLPERQPDVQAWPAFIDEVRSRHFDLIVQLHGSGGITNGIVSEWGARHVAAFHEPNRLAPDAMLGAPWPTQGTEPQRLMSLVSGLGEADVDEAPPSRWRLDFPLLLEDFRQARALLARHGVMPGCPYVCMHAGSQLPSRRWPTARFAEVGRALMAVGHTVVLTGVASEADIGHALMNALQSPGDIVTIGARGASLSGPHPGRCINLIGQTSLWSLGALIQDARLLVCNDTGVSHVAAALAAPSVVVSCGAEVSRWAPDDAALHRVLWADRACRPCAHAVCPFGHECALDVTADRVLATAKALLSAVP